MEFAANTLDDHFGYNTSLGILEVLPVFLNPEKEGEVRLLPYNIYDQESPSRWQTFYMPT